MSVRAHWIVSIRQQLIIVNLLVLAVLFLVGAVARESMERVRAHTETVIELGAAASAFQVADMRDDAIRADVLDLLDGQGGHAGTALDRHTRELRATLDVAREHWERAGVTAPFPPVEDLLNLYIADADHIVRVAATDRVAAAALYPAFAERYVAVDRRLGGAIESTFTDRRTAATELAVNVALRSETLIAAGAGVAGLVLTVLLWGVGRTLLNRLNRLAAVAERMRAGALDSRTDDVREDEVGLLGRSFNAMADGLSDLVRRHEADAFRTAFASRLANAFDFADTPREATAAVTRALVEIVPDRRAELLLADAAQATLERAAANPRAGAAGCPVGSPWACIAVRHATLVVASDSEAIDACPRLRGRPEGPCSAVCVPVNFMGRALGVVHVVGPQGEHPAAELVDQLAVLAGQTGNRLGTIGVLEKTQQLATVDPLTGLLNRRTIEDRAYRLVAAGQRFTVVMADLDQFKRLREVHGPDAADRALRRFAQVLQASARAADLVGRFGDEALLLVLPGTGAEGALVMLGRIRAALAAAGNPQVPAMTASFGVVPSNEGESFEDVTRRAGNALQRALRDGPDRVAVGEDGDAAAGRGAYGLAG